jgi:hypothetical protein
MLFLYNHLDYDFAGYILSETILIVCGCIKTRSCRHIYTSIYLSRSHETATGQGLYIVTHEV